MKKRIEEKERDTRCRRVQKWGDIKEPFCVQDSAEKHIVFVTRNRFLASFFFLFSSGFFFLDSFICLVCMCVCVCVCVCKV